MDSEKRKIPFIKKWWVSLRLFSLPFAIIPFVYGLLLATFRGGHSPDPWLVFFALLTVTLYSLGANLLSDIMDFKKGVDRWVHSTSGGIIRGWITPGGAKTATTFLFALGTVALFAVTWMTGPWILPLGALGFLLSLFYAAGNRFAFKYNFLGEYCVMFSYGVVIPLWAYAVSAGHVALWPALWAVPLGFILAAVKHANNWLESNLEEHGQPGITAVKIGRYRSRWYYFILVLLPYLLFFLMILPMPLFSERILLPATFYIVFLSLPYTLFLLVRSKRVWEALKPDRRFQLDTLTGGLFILFGTLCCIAITLA
jgi:1,4-dihydroxy-2-naphthoate octaprenyltransferase